MVREADDDCDPRELRHLGHVPALRGHHSLRPKMQAVKGWSLSRKVFINYQFDVLQIIDDVIYVYFVAEMLIKMVSEGLIKSWNFQLLEPTDLIEKKIPLF